MVSRLDQTVGRQKPVFAQPETDASLPTGFLILLPAALFVVSALKNTYSHTLWSNYVTDDVD